MANPFTEWQKNGLTETLKVLDSLVSLMKDNDLPIDDVSYFDAVKAAAFIKVLKETL
jgi:hypothetical protein